MADTGATRFDLQEVSTRVGRVALVTMDNGSAGRRPNVFGRAALESLHALLPALRQEGWRGLLLTGGPSGFAAGADIDELPALTDHASARAAGRAGHEAFGALRDLPYPTLAAVNGAAVGGGLEIALHCDFRTIARSVRQVGFPEVLLGIVPAWGGTQLTPRLVGARAAIELVVSNPLRRNRLVDAERAVEVGLADEILDEAAFLDDSLDWLVRAIEERRPRREDADLSDAAEACDAARRAVDDQVHGVAHAPYRALALVEGAASWSLADGYVAEEDALAELLPGPQAQAALYAYDLVERRVRRGDRIPDTGPRPIGCVGVVGAGLMATQLAGLFLRRLEVPVVLTDVEPGRVDTALATIRADLERRRGGGRLTEQQAQRLGSLVRGVDGLEGYAGCDLVLEAVVEELEVKRDVLGRLEHVVDEGCLLATNTSALSVTAMGAGLRHPQRLVGMHFFNPVAVLPLVELVRTASTSDTALATAWDVTGRLGKRGVLVEDAPAFVVNRLLTRMTTVLMGAVENGSSFEETDEAALRLGLPLPPSALLAMVGPRVANHVLHALHEVYPDRFPLSPTLDGLAAGDMQIVRTGERRLEVAAIHERILEALADECAHILDEGVVASAADIDTCLILGAGFPLFLGGITRHLDQIGLSQRLLGGSLAARGRTGSAESTGSQAHEGTHETPNSARL